jgi:hypothetical protein
MIIKLVFSMLRLNEFLSYCGEIIAFLKAMDKEGLQIDTIIDGFDSNYEKAIEIANRNRSSRFTELLKEKDHRRDESYIAFRNMIEACTHRKSADLAKTAENLCVLLRSHDWSLQRLGRAEQSAKLASLAKELSSVENTQALASLSATEWYQDLLDDNAAFLQLQEDKTKAQASEEDYDSLEVYKELKLACEQLFESIEVLNRIAPNEKYTEMINFINDCTQRYQAIAKTRSTKNENAKEVSEETEEQEA